MRLFNFLINNKFYFIVTPHLYTIGNSTEEIYLSLIKARKESRKVIFMIPYAWCYFYKRSIQCASVVSIETPYNISQKNILFNFIKFFFSFTSLSARILEILTRKISKKEIKIFRDFALCPRIGISELYNPLKGDYKSIKKNTIKYDWNKEFRKKLNLRKSFPRFKVYENILYSSGFKKEQKYVCLHMRSHKTYSDKTLARERSCDEKNYYEAINFLIKKGYKVVRMGDQNMPRMKAINGLFDYAHSQLNNSINDQYLIANCEFYIGTTSGIWGLAWMLEKDMIIVNNPSWEYSSPNSYSVDLYKRVFDKKNSRYLKLSEWIKDHHAALSFMKPIPNRYIFKENTSLEIKDAIKNYLNKKSLTISQRQKVTQLVSNAALKFIEDNNKYSLDILYRFYLMASLCKGRIDPEFYKKYF